MANYVQPMKALLTGLRYQHYCYINYVVYNCYIYIDV